MINIKQLGKILRDSELSFDDKHAVLASVLHMQQLLIDPFGKVTKRNKNFNIKYGDLTVYSLVGDNFKLPRNNKRKKS